MATSVSDNGTYPELCLQAAENDQTFQTFKQNTTYKIVLEHTGNHQADCYLQHTTRQMKGDSNKLFKWIKTAATVNDQFGTPTLNRRQIMGKPISISNSTVRYAKVAYDLMQIFGSLKGKKVIEIGGGYGGQCVVVHALSDFKSWTILDLPGPNALQERYIRTARPSCADKVVFSNSAADNFHAVLNDKYDLVISNYAFSELTREVQDLYAPLIQHSTNGYLTMNFFDLPGRFTRLDFQQMGKNVQVQQECDGMPHEISRIYYW
jgi:putative sugar O-methyltransferase